MESGEKWAKVGQGGEKLLKSSDEKWRKVDKSRESGQKW